MIRQHLDTAPVWAAYRTDCECPLCLLQAQSEASYVENFLGGSVMEPAVRIEVNEKGFCRRHLDLLYGAGNRLGLALMAHTHMQEMIRQLENAPSPAGSRTRWGKQPSPPSAMAQRCILCDRLENAMARYEETLLYMWRTESAFRDAFSQSKGLCLPHYQRLASRCAEALRGRELEDFAQALRQVTLDNLRRVEADLNWFTLKFDYRNRDKPWGSSRDAVERALIKLRGGVASSQEGAEAP